MESIDRYRYAKEQNCKRVFNPRPEVFSSLFQINGIEIDRAPFRSTIKRGTRFSTRIRSNCQRLTSARSVFQVERSRNYARTFGKRSVGRIERGCPQPRSAHFRTDNTPDLRNGDKFQISQPRVVACSYIQLYICFTRPIEGRVRVLHLRISFETNGWNEASLDRASRDSCSLPRRWLHAHWGKGKKKYLIRKLVQLSRDRSLYR